MSFTIPHGFKFGWLIDIPLWKASITIMISITYPSLCYIWGWLIVISHWGLLWKSMHTLKLDRPYLIGTWEILINTRGNNFETNFSNWWLKYLLWKCPQVIVTGPHWWYINIGSGNGLVPSGTKPLPEPMLTQFYVGIWCHEVTMS